MAAQALESFPACRLAASHAALRRARHGLRGQTPLPWGRDSSSAPSSQKGLPIPTAAEVSTGRPGGQHPQYGTGPSVRLPPNKTTQGGKASQETHHSRLGLLLAQDDGQAAPIPGAGKCVRAAFGPTTCLRDALSSNSRPSTLVRFIRLLQTRGQHCELADITAFLRSCLPRYRPCNWSLTWLRSGSNGVDLHSGSWKNYGQNRGRRARRGSRSSCRCTTSGRPG